MRFVVVTWLLFALPASARDFVELVQLQLSSDTQNQDPLASIGSQRVPPASAAEAAAFLQKEAELVAAFVAASRAAEIENVHRRTSLLAKTHAIEKQVCKDDDTCLAREWYGDYACATSTQWCQGRYAGDMESCCPASCNKCPDVDLVTWPTFEPVSPPAGDKLFFSIPGHAKIYTMSLDGSNVGTYIASGAPCPWVADTARANEATALMGRPEVVAVDGASNVIFWSDWLGGTADVNDVTYNASVLSSPLDGAKIDAVVTSAFIRPPPGHPNGIAGCDAYSTYACPPANVHEQAGGSLPISHLDSPTGLSIDPVEKMLYWSDRAQQGGSNGGPQNPKVQRASYDGFSKPPEDLAVPGMIGETVATAIDHRAGHRKIYWIEDVNLKMTTDGKTLYGRQIRRANLDGTGLEELATWLTRFPTGLALDLANEQFYWTEYLGGRIQRCPLAGCPPGDWGIGSKPEIVLHAFDNAGAYSSTTPKLGGIALDEANGMMYWTEDHTMAVPPGETAMIWGGMVKSAKFDGSDVRELYRFTAENELNKAAPFGISIFLQGNRVAAGRSITAVDAVTLNSQLAAANARIKVLENRLEAAGLSIE